MSKHTKGPWKYSNGTVIDGNGHVLRVNGVGLPCGFLSDQEREEVFANTKLIAAAPELLEALIDCRRTLEIANFTQELAVVNAAIAKAKGE